MIQGLLLTFMRFHLLVGWYPILRETPNSRAKPCLGSKFLSPDRSWRSWRGYNPLVKSIEAWFFMQNHLNLSYIITTDQIRTATRPLSKYPAARPLQRSWSAATGVQTCEVAGWSKFLEGPRGKLTQIWNIHGFSMGNDNEWWIFQKSQELWELIYQIYQICQLTCNYDYHSQRSNYGILQPVGSFMGSQKWWSLTNIAVRGAMGSRTCWAMPPVWPPGGVPLQTFHERIP